MYIAFKMMTETEYEFDEVCSQTKIRILQSVSSVQFS